MLNKILKIVHKDFSNFQEDAQIYFNIGADITETFSVQA